MHGIIGDNQKFFNSWKEDVYMARQWISFFQAVVLSVAGGGVFYLLDLPLPWLLGSLAAVSVAQVWLKREFYLPAWLYLAALLLLGYSLGSSFTREAGVQVLDHFPLMIAGTILTIAVSLALGIWVSKTSRLDLADLPALRDGCIPLCTRGSHCANAPTRQELADVVAWQLWVLALSHLPDAVAACAEAGQ